MTSSICIWILLVWLAVQVPLAVVLGRLIAAGSRPNLATELQLMMEIDRVANTPIYQPQPTGAPRHDLPGRRILSSREFPVQNVAGCD
jgi:hypothetical protein